MMEPDHERDPRRVLILLNGNIVGGVEVWALTYGARCGDATDYRPTFVSLLDGGFRTRAEDRGLDVRSMPTRSKIDLGRARDVAHLVRSEQFDLIHTHTVRANLIGRIAGRMADVPVVTHIHSRTLDESGNHLKNKLNWYYDRLTERWTDHFVFVAPSLQRDYPPYPATVIPNGVEPGNAGMRQDLREALGIPPGAPTFGAIAVLRARKGIDDLVTATKKIVARVPDARCVIVGSEAEPGYIDGLRAQAASQGIEDRVIFTGYRDDVPDLLHTLDVLVLPSLFGEGLPLIVLEALFAATPVVATAVEGTTLAIEDNQTGFLLEPRDVDGLAKRIAGLLEDPDERRRMGDRGRADAFERFTTDRMITDLHRVYDAVLEGRPQ